jgi:hypothetical protein
MTTSFFKNKKARPAQAGWAKASRWGRRTPAPGPWFPSLAEPGTQVGPGTRQFRGRWGPIHRHGHFLPHFTYNITFVFVFVKYFLKFFFIVPQ